MLPSVLPGPEPPQWVVHKTDAGARPLYRRNSAAFYWFKYPPESNTVYVNYNACREMQDVPFPEFTGRVLEQVDRTKVRLVVDVRDVAGRDAALEFALKARSCMRSFWRRVPLRARLLPAVLAAACGVMSDPPSPSGAARSSPVTLALQPYFRELKTVRIWAGQTSLTMLLDTGGGATLVTPDVAGRLGCRPFGRDVGHRMSGEQVEFRQCEAFDLSAGNWRRPAAPVGVLDVNALLPPELPRLDGVLALDVFQGEVITLDWPAGLVTVHARDAADAALRQHGLPVRIATGDNGRFFSAFVPVAATRGRLWFLLDSGNIAGTLVAQHVVREGLLTIGSAGDISLRVGSRPAFSARAATADLVIDGALGTAFLMRGPVVLDLRARLSTP